MLYLLYALLIGLLGISYLTERKDPFAPSVIFCLSFVFSCSWAVVFAKEWNLVLHNNTFDVLFWGVFTFVITSYLIRVMVEKTKGRKLFIQETPTTEVRLWMICFCIVFELIVIALSAQALKTITGISNIALAINAYDQSVKFSDNPYNYPRYINFLRRAVGALGYWFAYAIATQYAAKRKIRIDYAIVFGLSFVSQLLSGGRNASINLVLGLAAYFAFFFEKKKRFYGYLIPFKTIARVFVIALIILTLFQRLGVSMGRAVVTIGIDYIAGYCGAEIKNLDTFLQEPPHKSAIWGSQTFVNVINWLGPKVGWIEKSYRLDLPFRRVNGHNLGNVGTTFMSYYYDFGFVGVILLTLLMAVIVQLLYEHIKRARIKRQPSVSVITYGYMFSSLAFSFFSNKFYEQNLTPNFFRYILWWAVFNFVFCRLRFRSRKMR